MNIFFINNSQLNLSIFYKIYNYLVLWFLYHLIDLNDNYVIYFIYRNKIYKFKLS